METTRDVDVGHKICSIPKLHRFDDFTLDDKKQINKRTSDSNKQTNNLNFILRKFK